MKLIISADSAVIIAQGGVVAHLISAKLAANQLPITARPLRRGPLRLNGSRRAAGCLVLEPNDRRGRGRHANSLARWLSELS